MKAPTEKQAVSEIADLLAEILGKPSREFRLKDTKSTRNYDFRIKFPDIEFLVEYKPTAAAGPLISAVNHLKAIGEISNRDQVLLLVVPFMGPIGREICEQHGVSWMDLSGNAKIFAPGLRIWIQGQPNKFRGPGRPPNLFAPKSSRIARQLLFQPSQYQTQAELADKTELDDGYVSKIVRRLQNEEIVEANDDGAIRPRNPDVLLDAWHDSYDFNRHRILKGHMTARSGEEVLYQLVERFSRMKIDYAATGLGAAWLYSHFAAFRIVTFYLRSMPPRSILKEMGFWEEPQGANIWLVLPNDEGVFHDGQRVSQVSCVSPLQVYLDLKGHSERAKEAAEELRKELLKWGHHG